jgi:serine/threonine protein kinase
MLHYCQYCYPQQWPLDVPAAVQGLLEKALAPDPSDRYTCAGALCRDVESLATPPPDPLAETYQTLQQAMCAENWDTALTLAREITGQDPGYRNVQALARRDHAVRDPDSGRSARAGGQNGALHCRPAPAAQRCL